MQDKIFSSFQKKSWVMISGISTKIGARLYRLILRYCFLLRGIRSKVLLFLYPILYGFLSMTQISEYLFALPRMHLRNPFSGKSRGTLNITGISTICLENGKQKQDTGRKLQLSFQGQST